MENEVMLQAMATIQKRGTSYKITVSSGYDLSGKQIRHTMTWTPPDGMTKKQIQKEVNRQAVLFEEQVQLGQVLDGNIRFSDFSEQWLHDYAELQLRPTMVNSYRQIINRLNRIIGNVRLDKLRPKQIISLYHSLAEEGVAQRAVSLSKNKCFDLKQMLRSKGCTMESFAKSAHISVRTLREACNDRPVCLQSAEKICTVLNKPLTEVFAVSDEKQKLDPSTIRKHHAVLSSILATAVKWQMIPYNPCERIQPPKVGHKEVLYLDEKQAGHLLDLVQSDTLQHQVIVVLALYTGMRRAEICGLEWKDIDFKHSIINVNRSSLYLPEKGIFTDETKNNSSIRPVKVPDYVIQLLKKYRLQQKEQRLKLGDQWQDSGRILVQWNGAPIHPSTVTNWFHKFICNSDLPDIHLHSMRHTNITLQIAGGIPITTVAARAGHANSNTTSKIYAHAIKSADEAASQYLENILQPKTGKNRKKNISS